MVESVRLVKPTLELQILPEDVVPHSNVLVSRRS